jgi:hypothetical protein
MNSNDLHFVMTAMAGVTDDSTGPTRSRSPHSRNEEPKSDGYGSGEYAMRLLFVAIGILAGTVLVLAVVRIL